MSRKPREVSPMDTYHVIMRGVAKNNVFTCDEDKNKFKEVLFRYCEELNFGLISYILMDNHVHLEVRAMSEAQCGDLVKKVCISYVQHYFNKKYDRCGALFQSRFKSRAINSTQDLVCVSKYIHQNALVQGLPDPFRFTSYGEILESYGKKCPNKAIFAKPILQAMPKRRFENMVKDCDKTALLDEDYTFNDDQVRTYLCDSLSIESVGFMHKVETNLRNFAIKTLAENGITLKRLARITSLTKPELRQICFG